MSRMNGKKTHTNIYNIQNISGVLDSSTALNSTGSPYEMSRLTRDGTAEPVSRDQILRHERGQGNIRFSCSADHVQDCQPYLVDPCSCCMCDYTYIHT